MKKITYLVATLLIMVLLSGFSSTFEIVVNLVGKECPCFKLRESGIFFSSNNVQLNNFRIVERENGEWNYKKPLWAFNLKPGSALNVGEIKYGRTPNGFAETTAAKPLISGGKYQALGSGPGTVGSIDFEIQ